LEVNNKGAKHVLAIDEHQSILVAGIAVISTSNGRMAQIVLRTHNIIF